MTTNTFFTCDPDCAAELTLPAHDVNQDCTNYDQPLSQVSDLFLIPKGAPDIFAAFATTPTYVANSIDNANTDGTKAHWFVGEGSIPVPEKQTLQYPKGKEKQGERTYTLNFTIKNMSDAQYKACQAIQCGNTNFTFYYADLADYVYGKQGGIVPLSIDCDMPSEGNRDSRKQATIIIKFRAMGDPDRRVNPVPL